MEASFIRYKDFGNALSEIDFLVQIAKSYEKNADKYHTFNKSAILLLLAKFEVFLEDSVLEHASKLEQLRLSPDHLPESMKLHSTNSALNDEFVARLRNLNMTAIEELKLILPLWYSSSRLDTIYVNSKFDYGKHGPREIKKLFRRIGIKDVFEMCPIYERQETLNRPTKDRIRVDLVADINAMTNYRNHIIHEDRVPTLTHGQIQIYKNRLLLFAGALARLLDKGISQIKAKSGIGAGDTGNSSA